MVVKKADFLAFLFLSFYPLVFTIQARQVKLKIYDPGPSSSLETHFQPIIFNTVDSIFFSRTKVFSILKFHIGHFRTVIFKISKF